MKKKSIAWKDEVVTKGYLRDELKTFKVEFKTELKTELKRELRIEFRKEFATKEDLRNGLHDLEFRMSNRMDDGFESIHVAMRKQTDVFQQLADQVIVEHKNFEVESLSLRHNYTHLEDRVKKVEEIVFPGN